MSDFDNAKRDAADLAKLVNEDADVATRYGTNPKISAPKAIRQISESGSATIDDIQQRGDAAIRSYNITPAFDFANGFTIETRNQSGKDANGDYWIYNGTLPFTVAAGAVPSEPDYTNVIFSVITDSSIWGDRYVGTFASGFTYTSDTDVARGQDGKYYRYIGNDSYPVVVAAGTVAGNFDLIYKSVEFTSPNLPANLKDFGAVGNGVTDDTQSWNSFVAAGSGLIPEGDYLVNGVVKSYIMPTFVKTELNNHAAGYLAFESNTTGYNNFADGYRALQDNTTGFDNVAVGVQAMRKNTTGNRNTAIGVDALAKNTVGDHNLALGQNALGFNTTGTYNTALGIDALEFGLNNNFNTAIGQYAALNLDNSTNNTIIGYNSFQAATVGNGNVTLGFDTLRDQQSVSGNTAIGTEALRENTTGTFLTAVGFRAGRSNTVGTHLTLLGDQAGFKNLSGTHNLAMGFTALYNNQVGTYNVAIGDSALFSNTASNNIGIGGFAGYNITTGTQNTFIGHASGFSGSQKVDVVNSTAIGRGSFTTKDNTVQLGNPSVVGVGVGQNKMEWLATIPTTGTWARGSVVWNLNVSAGGSPGWVCVAAGTPGTWKAMAALEA